MVKKLVKRSNSSGATRIASSKKEQLDSLAQGKQTKSSNKVKIAPTKNQRLDNPTLKAISVAGYKSLVNKQRIEIRPLTVLAGANSGGKSSIMQPILLLKQTLDSPYDPGSLLLNGANVRLTSAEQLLSIKAEAHIAKEFSIELEIDSRKVELCFHHTANKGLDILRNIISENDEVTIIKKEMNLVHLKNELKNSKTHWPSFIFDKGDLQVVRERFFLCIEMLMNEDPRQVRLPILNPGESFDEIISKLIHVPGLRGNPERDYKTTAVGDTFPGTFEVYVASVIKHWQTNNDYRLAQLGKDLESLGLTWKVEAKQRDETQVELKVGRLPHNLGDAQDLVSIADVGFGVSQTLPVLVALLVAKPGQLVYIEQPEIHLHPTAQRALAKILAEAAKRKVIVIVETHSALLLQGIQTMVAEDSLSPNLVKLHWFQRDHEGITTVISADLDDTGAFGDWPEDFDDVQLSSENQYLSAAEAKLLKKNRS